MWGPLQTRNSGGQEKRSNLFAKKRLPGKVDTTQNVGGPEKHLNKEKA